MAVAEEVIACNCASIGEDPTKVRYCADCHRYWRGDAQLTSVTTVIKKTWPIPPRFSKADPAVLENARDRGVVCDQLFSRYVIGGLDRIPAGTRKDSVLLFMKLRKFWDNHKHGEVRSQVILADHEIAGTCDILDDDTVYDLKCSYNLEKTYHLQLAAYAQLHFATFGRPAKNLKIIHISERFPEPKIIKVDMTETLQNWAILREMWNLVRRLTA